MITLKNRFIIGCHVMFFEVDMIPDYIQSIKNALAEVSNPENVTVDFLFNISEYFERVDRSKTNRAKLIQKFKDQLDSLYDCRCNVTYELYGDNDKPYTMVDYRRKLNFDSCTEYDFVIWGESDCLFPRELFEGIETVKEFANNNGINRFVMTYAIRKMWDDSWKPLEHNDMTDKPVIQKRLPDGTPNPELPNSPWCIRYVMSIDEMNKINDECANFDIQILRRPQFDGSGLILSSDLLKNGINIPHCVIGHFIDDTAMMESCRKIMGENYVQFVIKNILKVHNREHPKKRLYALDMDSDRELSEVSLNKKGPWFYIMKDLTHFNLGHYGQSQAKFKTYGDFEDNLHTHMNLKEKQ